MLELQVDWEQCPPCERCLASLACLKDALMQSEPGALPAIQPHRCSGCGYCIPACPHDAIVECREMAYA